jgi:transitional endoplasmic reticulum ATPase
VVFLDELDVISNTEILIRQMESRPQNVLVFGATNFAENVAGVLRRPGRFDREILIGIPNIQSRKQILSAHLVRHTIADDVDVERLALKSVGFVGADLVSLIREAKLHSLERNAEELNASDFTV